MFSVSFSNQSAKFLRKAEKILVKRLIARIEELKYEPIAKDAKMIEGSKNRIFRIRVGNYRILYEVYYDENLIVISKIDKRERVY